MKAYQFLKQNGVSIAMLLGLVLSILCYVTITGGMPDLSTIADGDEKGKREILYAASNFEFTLRINEVLIGIGALFLIVFFVIQIIRDPKGSLQSIVMLVGTIILYFIFTAMGSSEMTPEAIKMGLDASTMKSIDAYLFLTYTFMAAAGAALVAMFVYNTIRNR